MKIKFFGLLIILSLLFVGCGTLTEDGTGLLFRTADPKLSVGFRLLPPSLVPTVTPEPPVPPIDEPEVLPEDEVIPEEETGEVLPDPTPVPPAIVIKGNISSSGEKIYHVPGGAYYDQVKIDENAGERFFESEEEAVAAGWRKSSR